MDADPCSVSTVSIIKNCRLWININIILLCPSKLGLAKSLMKILDKSRGGVRVTLRQSERPVDQPS